jgi:hypothetical protein
VNAWLIGLITAASACVGGALAMLGGSVQRVCAGEDDAQPRAPLRRPTISPRDAEIAKQLDRQLADLSSKLADLHARSLAYLSAGELEPVRAELLAAYASARDAYAHARVKALTSTVLLSDETQRAQAQAFIETATRTADSYMIQQTDK